MYGRVRKGPLYENKVFGQVRSGQIRSVQIRSGRVGQGMAWPGRVG